MTGGRRTQEIPGKTHRPTGSYWQASSHAVYTGRAGDKNSRRQRYSMKYKFRYCPMFLLVIVFAGFLSVSGTGITEKFACPGDSVQAFQNIAFNNCSSIVSLYTNGERYALIARWLLQDCNRNETLLPDYKDRMFLSGNGTISIHNVHPWDQAIYIVHCQMGNFSTEDVVKINVMAAPAKDCRPKILHLGNSLFASLKANVCGKPAATLYWMGYGDVSNTSEPVLKLTTGNEAGKYYACIKGPALQCARKSTPLDYCSIITIGGNIIPPILSETWDVKTTIFIMGGIVLGISTTVAIVVIVNRMRSRKGNSHTRDKTVNNNQHQSMELYSENKKGKETKPLLKVSQQQIVKPNLSFKWRFSGRTEDNMKKPWLLDLILNPDDDLIVTDGENNELKKFSLQGILKSKLPFETRPDCLALTDGYLAMVTFPHETVLRVIDTRDKLSLVSTIPFRSQCAGIGSMNDGRLIICDRESRSLVMSSKDGEILQEIKTGSSGETLFRKPSYVRVVDNKTIYVSDCRTEEFFIININDDNTSAINKHKINYPRASCVVDGMLLVAASNIRLFTLDGNEAGEVTLDGVHHVRGLAFSEGKRLLAITHQSDADEEISVYEVMKH